MAGIKNAYDAFVSTLAGIQTGVTCHLGAEFVREEDAAPRVVWVPTSEPITPPSSQGSAVPAIGNPRRLWERRCAIQIHIWGANRNEAGEQPYEGADIQATEVLLDQVALALWNMLTGGTPASAGTFGVVRELSGQWNLPGALNVLGGLYILTATLVIPLVRATDLTGNLNSIPTTVQIKNPATGTPSTDVVINLGT